MTIKKIININSEELKNSLISNSITVCVVGIGRIGLPTALSFANSGLNTIGLDINVELITLTSGSPKTAHRFSSVTTEPT